MKNLIKPFLVGMILIGSTISCTDSELAIDALYEGVDASASFIRTLEKPLDLVNVSNPEMNEIAALIEIQGGNGSIPSDFKEVRMFAQTFNDQDQVFPTVDDQGNELTEILIGTFPADGFAPSDDNNLPSQLISVTTQTILDLNPTGIFTIPSFIFVRLELEMNDGTIYTNTNVGPGVSAGNYFLASFAYNIIFLNL